MFNNLVSAMPWQNWIFIGLLVVMVVVLVVLPMFTNKKRQKAVSELHNALKPGDVIKTVGGIIGTITAIREISPVDKEMVVETGDGESKCRMVFDVQAVYQVISKVSEPKTEVFAEVDAKKEEIEVVPETETISAKTDAKK